MKKAILLFLITFTLFFVGCTIKNLSLNKNVKKPIENKSIYTDKTQDDIDNKLFCKNNDDCIIVISDCPACPPCEKYELIDPALMAVNKLYKCPPRPKDVICPSCTRPTQPALNPENAICINNKCEKSGQTKVKQGELGDKTSTLFNGIELKRNCINDSDCVGRSCPFECFNKETSSLLTMDCTGLPPTCSCINNLCTIIGQVK